MAHLAAERLSRRTKLLYGMGDVGFSLTSTLIGVYYLLFLTDVVGLRPALAGLAMMIAKQWDWVNDPLIGHLSDRTRSRWGRRRPFLAFGLAPFALAFAMMWWRPPIHDQGGLAAYYAVVLVLYDTVATFVYMPYFALTPELTLDYDERTALTTYRMGFSILGSLVAFTAPWAIIGAFRPENAARVWLNGVVFAAASALPLLGTFLGTRERPEFEATARPSLRESVQAALKNRPFLFAAGIFLLTWLAVDVIQAILLYFIRYWLHRESQSDAIFAVIFVTALLVLPFWEWASRHTNKRQAYIFGIAFWAFVQIILAVVSAGTPTMIVFVLCAFAGIGVAAAHVLPWAMIPDTVEWDELQSGQRHEGMYYSLIMLMQKAASGIALFAIGLALDWSGYVANASSQPSSALAAIRWITGAAPATLLCIGIGFAVLFPIERHGHYQVREALERRRLAQDPPTPEG